MDPMMTSSEVGRVNPLDLVQAKCLKKSMSEDVKRAITRSLNATAVCSKVSRVQLAALPVSRRESRIFSKRGGGFPTQILEKNWVSWPAIF